MLTLRLGMRMLRYGFGRSLDSMDGMDLSLISNLLLQPLFTPL